MEEAGLSSHWESGILDTPIFPKPRSALCPLSGCCVRWGQLGHFHNGRSHWAYAGLGEFRCCIKTSELTWVLRPTPHAPSPVETGNLNVPSPTHTGNSVYPALLRPASPMHPDMLRLAPSLGLDYWKQYGCWSSLLLSLTGGGLGCVWLMGSAAARYSDLSGPMATLSSIASLTCSHSCQLGWLQPRP